MLIKALEEYVKTSTLYRHSEYDLYVSDCVTVKKNIFKVSKPFVRIIVDLKNTLVPLEAILQTINAHYSRIEYQQYKKIQCLWFVCSSHGGIYLYEAVAAKEAKKTGKLHNTFIIMNTDNGTVSFGPGHKHNKEFSQRLGNLLRSSRFFTREKWLEQIFDVFMLSEHIRYKGSLV